MTFHSRLLPPHRRLRIEEEIDAHLQRVSVLLARLDRADGDCDLEDDDPAGDPLDISGEAPSDDGRTMLPALPIYALDQTTGPINEAAAIRSYNRAQRMETM